MQRFVFRLERVLQWQMKLCRIEEENVRSAQAVVAEYERQIAELRAEAAAAQLQLYDRGALLGSELAAFAKYRVQVAVRGGELEAQRKSAAQALAWQLQKLTEVRRQLKRIEALRDRSLAEYNIALDRELDALALESHLAKRKTSCLAI